MGDGDVRTLKCILVGEEAVGKTSLIVSYTTNGFVEKYQPTAFDNYSVVVRVDKKPIRVQLCDTAGQVRNNYHFIEKTVNGFALISRPSARNLVTGFYALSNHSTTVVYQIGAIEEQRGHLDSIRPLSYTDSDVFIIVYSVVNPSSFTKVIDRWLPEITKSNFNTPVVLVGTQMDKRWSAPAHSVVSTAKGRALASQIKAVDFFECSALTQGNVKLMFDAAIVAGLEGRRVLTKKSRLRQGLQRFVNITKKVF